MTDDFLIVNSGSTPPAPRAQSPPAPAPEESETPYQPFVSPAVGDDLPEIYSASDDEVAGYIAQAKVKAVRAKGVLLTSAMFFAAVSLVLFAGAAGRGHMMKVAGESDAEGDAKAAGRVAEPEPPLLAPPSPLSYPPPPSPPTPSPPPPSPWPARVIHWTGTYALGFPPTVLIAPSPPPPLHKPHMKKIVNWTGFPPTVLIAPSPPPPLHKPHNMEKILNWWHKMIDWMRHDD